MPQGPRANPRSVQTGSRPGLARQPCRKRSRAPSSHSRLDCGILSDAPVSLFAGDWAYTPTPADAKSGRRRSPALIEFRLAEKDGILNGDYRARYQAAPQSASQGVLFQVRGRSPIGDVATLAWTSDDGASGEMDLFLQPPNSLRVTWWTIKSGRHAGLNSDIASLRRR
jgi:hypothetical protein